MSGQVWACDRNPTVWDCDRNLTSNHILTVWLWLFVTVHVCDCEGSTIRDCASPDLTFRLCKFVSTTVQGNDCYPLVTVTPLPLTVQSISFVHPTYHLWPCRAPTLTWLFHSHQWATVTHRSSWLSRASFFWNDQDVRKSWFSCECAGAWLLPLYYMIALARDLAEHHLFSHPEYPVTVQEPSF